MTDPIDEVERPTTSDRDYDELQARLSSWIATRFPDGADPVLSPLEVPERNGMSSETVLFDVEITEDGDRTVVRCVGRLEPQATAVPVFPTYDFDKQFRVMRLVEAHSKVPVPRALWYEPDPAAVGAPFFVMERVEGEVPPDVMPYNFGDSWLYDASPEDQRRLQDNSVAVLAELHAIEPVGTRFDFLELDRPEPTALRRHVGDQWDYYRWVAADRPHPVLERCFAWLEEHWPEDEGEARLSWGDSRIGNMLFRDFTPVGVLDWEMAGVAPREVDLAWMIFLHRFFEDLAVEMGLPGMPDFLRPDDVAGEYEACSGHTPRNLDFYIMYAALRHGVVMSRVQQRSIAFGEADPPEDVDDLIMHRATLEKLLAGTYLTGL